MGTETEQMEEKIDARMSDGWMDRQIMDEMNIQTDGQKAGQMDGCMDRWVNG